MHVLDGRKPIGLWIAAVLGVMLTISIAGCGRQDHVPEPVTEEEAAVSSTLAPQAAPAVALVELVHPTATPYSRKVPSPVVVTSTLVPTETATLPVDATAIPAAEQPEPVSAQDIDCGDFEDWIEAQEFFLRNGGPGEDPSLLDTDMDGIACNAETDRGYPSRVFASSEIPVATPAAKPSPTPAHIATAVPAVMAGDWPTPEELGAVKWGKFTERGYFTKGVSNGKTIYVYESPKSAREVTCGPDVGTAFDRSNPTWSEASHWIFFWRVPKVGLPGCRGASKYEDWVNKPLPAPQLERREWDGLFVKWGDPLKFALDDTVRDFSLADWRDSHYVVHDRIVLEDGWVSKCDETTLPWAAWGRERGFYTISIEDEEAQKRHEWTDEQVLMKEEGRARGLYFIYKGLGAEFGSGNYCWHVPNHEEIPPHRPCLECQWRVQ